MTDSTSPPSGTAPADAPEDRRTGDEPRRTLPRLSWPALAAAAAGTWWLLGHLGWLLDGLQPHGYGGLSALELPEETRLAVPLLTSLLPDLLVGSLVGGLAAGLLGLLGRGSRWSVTTATLAGLLLSVAGTLAQAVRTLGATPGDAFGADPRVVTGLVLTVLATSLTGWAIGSCGLLGRVGAGPAVAVLAGALPAWLFGVVQALAPDGRLVVLAFAPAGHLTTVGTALTVAGAVLLGGALVLVGLQPHVRALAWPLLFLSAWAVGPVLTAAGYLAPLLRPAAGLPGSLPESLRATAQVFGEAWSPGTRLVWPWVLAVLVALAVAGTRTRSREDGAPTLTG